MQQPRRKPAQTAFLVFALFMSVVYVVLGVILFTNRPAINLMPEGYQQLFGGLIIAYGLFRGYRAWVDFRVRAQKGYEE